MTEETLHIKTDNGKEYIADLRRFDIEKSMSGYGNTVTSVDVYADVGQLVDVTEEDKL